MVRKFVSWSRRWRWSRGVGVGRCAALRFTFGVGFNPVLAEAAHYVSGSRQGRTPAEQREMFPARTVRARWARNLCGFAAGRSLRFRRCVVVLWLGGRGIHGWESYPLRDGGRVVSAMGTVGWHFHLYVEVPWSLGRWTRHYRFPGAGKRFSWVRTHLRFPWLFWVAMLWVPGTVIAWVWS